MQKRYYEFYAKVIIEEIFNINLEVIDKPDLHNEVENIGIEFTSAEDSDNKEIESLGIILAENKAKNRENVIKKIKSKGGKYTQWFILGKATSFEEDKKRIYNAIENKLKKLNLSAFKKFKENDLSVFSTIRKIKKEEQKDFLEEIKEIQSKYQNKFDKIYLLLLHSIYTIDIERNEITKKDFSNDEYAEKAKESMDNYKI